MKILLIIPWLILFYSDSALSQSWAPLGSGTNGTVYAITQYGNDIIAGGNFSVAGGVTAYYIAKWNGNSWSPIGNPTGFNGIVRALTVYNGELIAGGEFTTAGNVSAGRIAKWNGNEWSALGLGCGGLSFNIAVYTLTVSYNDLIAGGEFPQAGGLYVSNVAKWNGTSWSPLGAPSHIGTSGQVNALTTYGDYVVVGGNFGYAGEMPASNIASWDRFYNIWDTFGDGVNSPVTALSNFAIAIDSNRYNRYLFIGGDFNLVNNFNANRIVGLGPNGWFGFGSGADGMVYAIIDPISYGTRLVIGGHFSEAGGVTAHRIAYWNEQAWYSMGNINNDVFALSNSPNSNDIYAGGMFTSAGGVTANHIAKWIGIIGINNISTETPGEYKLSQNYPNPFNPSTKIKFSIPKISHVNISVFDELGRLISILVNEQLRSGTYEAEFDGSKFASGIYLYKLETDEFAETKKMILMK